MTREIHIGEDGTLRVRGYSDMSGTSIVISQDNKRNIDTVQIYKAEAKKLAYALLLLASEL